MQKNKEDKRYLVLFSHVVTVLPADRRNKERAQARSTGTYREGIGAQAHRLPQLTQGSKGDVRFSRIYSGGYVCAPFALTGHIYGVDGSFNLVLPAKNKEKASQ